MRPGGGAACYLPPSARACATHAHVSIAGLPQRGNAGEGHLPRPAAVPPVTLPVYCWDITPRFPTFPPRISVCSTDFGLDYDPLGPLCMRWLFEHEKSCHKNTTTGPRHRRGGVARGRVRDMASKVATDDEGWLWVNGVGVGNTSGCVRVQHRPLEPLNSCGAMPAIRGSWAARTASSHGGASEYSAQPR